MKDDFLVRPVTAGGWDYIAAALVRLFGRLRATGEKHCVIIDVTHEHYVQFIVRPDGTLWAEAVGDVHLSAGGFDDEQRRLLAVLGWGAADPDGPGEGNYWREYETPGCDLDAAATAVLTCLDVFGCGPRTRVRVKVFEAVR
jgi:hypothetical protein